MEKVTIDIDYKKEYERLKAIEGENIELKETMINMAKNIFKRDNSLIEIIYKIEKELDRINKKIGE